MRGALPIDMAISPLNIDNFAKLSKPKDTLDLSLYWYYHDCCHELHLCTTVGGAALTADCPVPKHIPAPRHE